jgi:hypothetical protein
VKSAEISTAPEKPVQHEELTTPMSSGKTDEVSQ